MAKVYITEYADLALMGNGQALQTGLEPPLATQTVAIGAGSVQSSAFNAKTKFVRLHTDAICSILFGTNPTADANSPRMAANTSEFFAVPLNQSFKVAVITNT